MELVKYDAMVTAIAVCESYDEAKDIRDKSIALQAYFKQAQNYEAEHKCSVIRVRAERKAGEILAQMEKAKGTLKQGTILPQSNKTTTVKTLTEMGITKDQSAKWQALAKVPEKEFEQAVSAPPKTEDGKRNTISTNKILNPDYPTAPKPKMNEHALWWWGTLIRLEKDSRFSLSVDDLLSEMTDAMRSDSEIMFTKLRNFLNE